MITKYPTWSREEVVAFLNWLKITRYCKQSNEQNRTLLEDAIKYLTKDNNLEQKIKLIEGKIELYNIEQTFTLNKKEKEEADTWLEEHKKNCPDYLKTKMRHVTYQFTPTGIGDVIIIKCGCGAFKEITDISCW